MKIGYLKIMEPMQNTRGRVVLSWHRIAWWKWGLWWFPNTAVLSRRIGFSMVGSRFAILNLGSLGCFHFQVQR
jgi:hypothetical protein